MSPPEILETIVDQFTRAIRAGEYPSIAEYQQQYPELADEIQDLLSSVAMIEQLKSDSETRTDRKHLLDTVSQLRKIGNYKIIGELGRGGMGVVFAAVHESLGRRVAIKVMPTPLVDGEKYVERFRREAQSAARLHHTNIVGVFGVGEEDRFHYYVMDLVEGTCLSEIIESLRMQSHNLEIPRATELSRGIGGDGICDADQASQLNGQSDLSSNCRPPVPANEKKYFRWAAARVANVADALTHAHSLNILHRDIKPSNMILDRQGVIWITDFGLAKDNTHELNLTRTGDVIGTPQYLAPESLEGNYDQRSETYCLGLTLSELVTQQPAYPSGSPAEILRAIATRSPIPVRKINSRIPLDLATIIDKSVSREPSLRYQTALEMKQDLVAYAEDRPISARRPNAIESTIRWSKRNPLPATLSAISALLLVLVAASATIGYITTTAALTKEAEKSERLRQQQRETEVARIEAEQNFRQMKAQHERAEANVAISIEAFDEMFKQVIARGATINSELDIDGFREISGIETSLTKNDAEFLNRLVGFYARFATLNAENEQLKAESAKAFRRVGNIYQLVGEMKSAISAYERSIELYDAFFNADPTSTENLLSLVQTQNEMSAACRQRGDLVAAHDWIRRSLQLLEKSPLSGHDPAVRLEHARTLSVLGFNLFRVVSITSPDRNESAKPNVQSNSPSKLGFPSTANQRSPDPVAEFFKMGRRNFERRNHQLIQQAIEIMDELVAESPDNDEYRSVRATCYCVLVAANLDADRKNGFEIRDKAIQAFEKLVAAHPENPEYRYLWALACTLGSTELQPGDSDLLQRAAQTSEELIEQFPQMLDYHHLHASLKIKLAVQHNKQQQNDLALADLKSATDSIEHLLAQTPSDRSFQRTMVALITELQNLAKSYRESGNLRTAGEINQLARQVRGKMRMQVQQQNRD